MLFFRREMFCHINKKGMEVTLHFLFNRLDSHITYEEFRYTCIYMHNVHIHVDILDVQYSYMYRVQ